MFIKSLESQTQKCGFHLLNQENTWWILTVNNWRVAKKSSVVVCVELSEVWKGKRQREKLKICCSDPGEKCMSPNWMLVVKIGKRDFSNNAEAKSR